MRKSGLADSPFFSKRPPKAGTAAPLSEIRSIKTKQEKRKDHKQKRAATTHPSNRGINPPRNHDTTVSRYHDTIIELVRKAVKEFGKEAATHRFTAAEKKALADIIYAYKNRDIRTSENVITRIAVNFIVFDYRENGETSVLDRALKALNG